MITVICFVVRVCFVDVFMSSLRTNSSPKKPSSDVCRVCGSSFAKHKRDKVSLFRCEANLHVILEEATGFPVRQHDGLPHFACTSCRTKMWKFQRAQKELEEMRTFLCEQSRKTALECRFKRRLQVTKSPGSPSSRHVSKRADLAASPVAPSGAVKR